MKLTLGKREVDLSNAFPLTLGDLRALGKTGLLNESGDLNLSGAEGIIGLLMHVANKSLKEGDEPITDADVESLPLTDLPKVTAFFTEAMGGEEVDRPT